MTDFHRWMGNNTLDYGSSNNEYIKMSPLQLVIYTKSVFKAQQTRSYFLSLAEKEDIWDSKNSFENEIMRMIQRENFMV